MDVTQTNLTERNLQVLDVVRRYNGVRGYGPTLDELAATLGMASRSVVYHHLTRLREAGLVTWEKDKARTVRPTDGGAAESVSARIQRRETAADLAWRVIGALREAHPAMLTSRQLTRKLVVGVERVRGVLRELRRLGVLRRESRRIRPRGYGNTWVYGVTELYGVGEDAEAAVQELRERLAVVFRVGR